MTGPSDPLGEHQGAQSFPEVETASYDYDVLGRLTELRHPNEDAFQYTYDTLGRQQTVLKGQWSVAFTETP